MFRYVPTTAPTVSRCLNKIWSIKPSVKATVTMRYSQNVQLYNITGSLYVILLTSLFLVSGASEGIRSMINLLNSALCWLTAAENLHSRWRHKTTYFCLSIGETCEQHFQKQLFAFLGNYSDTSVIINMQECDKLKENVEKIEDLVGLLPALQTFFVLSPWREGSLQISTEVMIFIL